MCVCVCVCVREREMYSGDLNWELLIVHYSNGSDSLFHGLNSQPFDPPLSISPSFGHAEAVAAAEAKFLRQNSHFVYFIQINNSKLKHLWQT